MTITSWTFVVDIFKIVHLFNGKIVNLYIEVSIDCGIWFHNFNCTEFLVRQLPDLLDLFLRP